MPDSDFGAALDFIDTAEGIPRQLRFQRNWAPPDDPRIFDGAGQLVAVIAATGRPDNGHTLPITRPDVDLDHVERVLEGWQDWAKLSTYTIDLAAIRRRIQAAGLT